MNHRHRELTFIALGGVLLLGVGAALVFWRGQPSMPMAQAASEERTVLYWHDPMVPHARFDKPGKSPFMDMQLVPVYADDTAAQGTVRVPSNVSQSLGIRTGKVERMEFQPRLTATGAVKFDERLLQVVAARVDGVVLQLHVRAPLEAVRKGQPLATLQVPAWIGAQQEYLALLDARSEPARALLAAARERLRLLGVPDAAIQRIEARREVEATTTIVTPVDGVVRELGVREGSAFTAGAPLFHINGLSSVWVDARIPEAQVSFVQVGKMATATATAWPGEKFQGTVTAMLPEVDSATRTMNARVAIDNRDRRLSPGMFVSLTLPAAGAGTALVVPDEAVIATGTRTVVVTVNVDGSFGIANVRIGARQDGHSVVLEGLTEGQQVVLSGQFLIDSEASLRSALPRLQSQAAGADRATAGAPMSHHTEGKIVALDAESVTVDHIPVASLQWPAMTMRFAAPATGLPPSLAVGDRIAFSFSATDAGYRIESIDAGAKGGRDAPR
jgi:Cu(I)/Ag(I) efflux system membrane fusion protein